MSIKDTLGNVTGAIKGKIAPVGSAIKGALAPVGSAIKPVTTFVGSKAKDAATYVGAAFADSKKRPYLIAASSLLVVGSGLGIGVGIGLGATISTSKKAMDSAVSALSSVINTPVSEYQFRDGLYIENADLGSYADQLGLTNVSINGQINVKVSKKMGSDEVTYKLADSKGKVSPRTVVVKYGQTSGHSWTRDEATYDALFEGLAHDAPIANASDNSSLIFSPTSTYLISDTNSGAYPTLNFLSNDFTRIFPGSPVDPLDIFTDAATKYYPTASGANATINSVLPTADGGLMVFASKPDALGAFDLTVKVGGSFLTGVTYGDWSANELDSNGLGVIEADANAVTQTVLMDGQGGYVKFLKNGGISHLTLQADGGYVQKLQSTTLFESTHEVVSATYDGQGGYIVLSKDGYVNHLNSKLEIEPIYSGKHLIGQYGEVDMFDGNDSAYSKIIPDGQGGYVTLSENGINHILSDLSWDPGFANSTTAGVGTNHLLDALGGKKHYDIINDSDGMFYVVGAAGMWIRLDADLKKVGTAKASFANGDIKHVVPDGQGGYLIVGTGGVSRQDKNGLWKAETKDQTLKRWGVVVAQTLKASTPGTTTTTNSGTTKP